MKILVCGDRHWTNYDVIWHRLYPYRLEPTIILHGGAPGADRIAGDIAKELHMDVQVIMADWDTYGKWAGPRRNTEMLHEHPNLVLAFHNNISESKGTKDLVLQAMQYFKPPIPIEIIREETGSHPWIKK